MFRSMRYGAAMLLLVLLAAEPAAAQAVPAGEGQQSSSDHWQVHLAVGDVNWRSLPATAGDSAWQPVRSGAILEPPAEIETATDARIELRRGEDWIQAGADTRLTLEDSPGDLMTLIRQAAGSVWYKVKSIAGRRFEVRGRYLVATVKGTEFRVVLGSQGDLLRVTEGVVRATPITGGDGLDITAGQSVLVTPSGLLLLVTPGDGPGAPAPSPAPAPLPAPAPAPAPLEQTPPGGGEPTGSTPLPAPQEPAPSDPPDAGEPPIPPAAGELPPAAGEPPASEDTTGDVHSQEQHNHGGERGAGVRDSHGESKSDNGGGANAKGPN